MTESSKPTRTSTAHPLHFSDLSDDDFERLCLWLVEREGWEDAEHLGAAGSEQGRDIVAWRKGRQWAFQCKRVQRFGPKDAVAEVEKVLTLPKDECPRVLMFLATCNVSARTRKAARAACPKGMKCCFWGRTKLDEMVKRHPDILSEFFHIPAPLPSPHHLPPNITSLPPSAQIPSCASRRLTWRGVLRAIGVVAWLITIPWLIYEPGFEPAVAFLTGLAAILGSFIAAASGSAPMRLAPASFFNKLNASPSGITFKSRASAPSRALRRARLVTSTAQEGLPGRRGRT